MTENDSGGDWAKRKARVMRAVIDGLRFDLIKRYRAWTGTLIDFYEQSLGWLISRKQEVYRSESGVRDLIIAGIVRVRVLIGWEIRGCY